MTKRSDYIDYIRDIIDSLDSDDTMKGNELVPAYAYTPIQKANRAFQAHQAIEIGLKARLTKANLCFPKTGKKGHDLRDLYNRTKKINNGQWAADLAKAFTDAVTYYEYDVNALPHLATLEAYLVKIGSADAFMTMRYFVLEDKKADEAIELMSDVHLLLHREILEALLRLVARDNFRPVSERAEQAIRTAMRMDVLKVLLVHSPETESEQTYLLLDRWLKTHPNYRTALREAVQQEYQLAGIDEAGCELLRQAFERLSTTDHPTLNRPPSADPAISFFIRSFGDIRPGSLKVYPGASVRVEWCDEGNTNAEIFTPAGEVLGDISKHAQSRWKTQTMWNNEARYSKSFEDARDWIITCHCKQVAVTSGGEKRELYIFATDTENPFDPVPGFTPEPDIDWGGVYEINFWDETHTLIPGQQVTITSVFDEESRIGDKLEGVVSSVQQRKVEIVGMSIITRID